MAAAKNHQLENICGPDEDGVYVADVTFKGTFSSKRVRCRPDHENSTFRVSIDPPSSPLHDERRFVEEAFKEVLKRDFPRGDGEEWVSEP